EGFAKKLGINGPKDAGIVMKTRHRPVGSIFRMEDEEGLITIKLGHCRVIKTFDQRFSLTLEGVVHHKHVEEEHGEREQIRLYARQRDPLHDFRGHETRRTEDTSISFSINRHVIVVADNAIPVVGVEKNVAERDVAITEPLGM